MEGRMGLEVKVCLNSARLLPSAITPARPLGAPTPPSGPRGPAEEQHQRAKILQSFWLILRRAVIVSHLI